MREVLTGQRGTEETYPFYGGSGEKQDHPPGGVLARSRGINRSLIHGTCSVTDSTRPVSLAVEVDGLTDNPGKEAESR